MTELVSSMSDLTPDRVVALLWSQWRFLVKAGLIFAGIGVICSFLAPTEYMAETRLMPEFQAGAAANLKRFGALAELVGIDLGSDNNTEAVRPDLYPDVLASTPFLLTVLNQPVTATGKKTYPSLITFLTISAQNPLFWLKPVPLTMPPPGSIGLVRLSKEQEDVLKDLQKRIVSDLDQQSGIISIRVKMPDAEVAAQVCQQAIGYLTNYVAQYRTGKTRTNLAFVTQRRSEAKVRYDRALTALSAYDDQNRFLFKQLARVEGKRLEAEHNLSQALYDDLSRQYEQTRLKIQEETPILMVLEPPKVPARRSEPRRTLIVLAFTGVGLVAGVGWIVGKALSRMPAPGISVTTGRGHRNRSGEPAASPKYE